MKNIRITYSYDGSKFNGMQRQPNLITVQGEIEKVLKHVFNEDINLITSGRTDINVHALAQVSNFIIKKDIPIEAIKRQINKNLFSKINISKIEYVNDNFNSRYDAIKRVYEYRFKNQKNITPFEFNYISKINDNIEIDIDLINKKLTLFIGKHDFSNYYKLDKVSKNPIREIFNAYCYKENDVCVAIIEGSSFLKSMIRLIMASCIYDDIETIKNKLNLKNQNKTKKILSPHGLYLKEVIYDN